MVCCWGMLTEPWSLFKLCISISQYYEGKSGGRGCCLWEKRLSSSHVPESPVLRHQSQSSPSMFPSPAHHQRGPGVSFLCSIYGTCRGHKRIFGTALVTGWVDCLERILVIVIQRMVVVKSFHIPTPCCSYCHQWWASQWSPPAQHLKTAVPPPVPTMALASHFHSTVRIHFHTSPSDTCFVDCQLCHAHVQRGRDTQHMSSSILWMLAHPNVSTP